MKKRILTWLLAIRSGYYEKMNCSVVYKDELVSYNPITGEVEFVTDFSKCTQRVEGKSEIIIGLFRCGSLCFRTIPEKHRILHTDHTFQLLLPCLLC